MEWCTSRKLGNNLSVHLQEPRGSFTREPLVLGGLPLTDAPAFVVAADLDGDGDIDLASANEGGNDLTVFLQRLPGRFVAGPPIGGFPTTNGPVALTAEDLDGDGDRDLASANFRGNDLTIFFGGR